MTHLQLLQHNTKAWTLNTLGVKKKKKRKTTPSLGLVRIQQACLNSVAVTTVLKSSTGPLPLWLVAHDSWTIRQTRKRTSAYGKISQTLSESILSSDLCAKAFHRSWSKHMFLLWPAAAAHGSLAELPSDHIGIGKNSVCAARVWERQR